MSKSETVNHLADKRTVTLILRLVLDENGLLVYGKILDVEGRNCGQIVKWRGLTRALRTCIAKWNAKSKSA